ncbi:hypothetical protein [uncultured Eubacterium sp.]|uniref:hypothetical protein n=1 Tax=uncultured Eubacterium sp. TaxID=165185 RepID=UPI003265B7BC
MKNTVKKAMAIAIAVSMTTSIATVGYNKIQAQETNKTVTFSVEKFTIGQGYVVEPVSVEVSDDMTISDVFEKVMNEKEIKYTGSKNYGYLYLQSIENADTGIIDIPEEIAKMPSYESSYEYEGETYTTSYSAPSNEKNDGNTQPNNGLGEYSYNSMAGWMISVNGDNDNGNLTPADIVKDGDVIRYQFSVYGWGADVGLSNYAGMEPLKVADKTTLTKELAKINKNKAVWMNNENVKTAYENAIKVATKLMATQDEVDEVVAELKKAENETTTVQDATTVQATTTEIQTLGKATVNSVKKVKARKAKISIKKIAGAEGYQYKYSSTKNFKKGTVIVKTTKKNVLITKKFKKNQKCYVKVRAYKTVNKVRVYGKWSKVKSVKIK